jgi:hypothetical protein
LSGKIGRATTVLVNTWCRKYWINRWKNHAVWSLYIDSAELFYLQACPRSSKKWVIVDWRSVDFFNWARWWQFSVQVGDGSKRLKQINRDQA